MSDLGILSGYSVSPTHATQGSVAKTPYFLETIPRPALITDESGRSGRNSGLDGQAEKTTIPNEFRESLERLSRIEIRADYGRFWPNS
jgi:hypothetical protein